VVITSDTKMEISEESLELMRDADLMLADAITPPGYTISKHMTADEAMVLGERLGAKRLLLTIATHPLMRWPSEMTLGHDMMEWLKRLPEHTYCR
jgi:phosphoribosyl 1,2-cyclic phosphate phosphodiesterase